MLLSFPSMGFKSHIVIDKHDTCMQVVYSIGKNWLYNLELRAGDFIVYIATYVLFSSSEMYLFFGADETSKRKTDLCCKHVWNNLSMHTTTNIDLFLICRCFHKEFRIEGAIVVPYAVLELVITSTG